MSELKDYLLNENFIYTSWANPATRPDASLISKNEDKKDYDPPRMEKLMKSFLSCCSCSKFITDASLCRLHEQSKDQACPLEVCR